ncbi:MAG: hypothetical protein RR705_00170 [Lachnospiraceae bacterium]
MNTKRMKQVGVLAMTAILCTEAVCTVNAAPVTDKDEVIYATLDEEGNNAQIYVVNSFDMGAAGQVLDYGNYLEVKNLSSKEPIEMQNGTVDFQAEKGKNYYQGTMQGKELPWDVAVTYTLDGKSITGEELAGKSGNLEMKLKLTQNSEADSVYREHFALQATVVLEGKHASDIEASGATAANVGENKQLTYVVLPDTDKEFVITAKVTDFEMDGIQVNGIPLSIDVDDPDSKEMKDKMLDLKDGAVELNDGTKKLKDGTSELNDGTTQISDGAGSLKDGIGSLNSGALQLKDGTASLSSGAASLTSGIGQYWDGVGTLAQGMASLESGSADLAGGSDQFIAGIQGVSGQSQALGAGAAQMGAGLSQLAEAVNGAGDGGLSDMQQGAQELAGGSGNYLAAIGQVIDAQSAQRDQMIANGLGDSPEVQVLSANIDTLYQLQNQYSQINDGVHAMANGISQSGNMLSQFQEGVNALNSNYADLQNGIAAYTGGVDELSLAYGQIHEGIKGLQEGAGQLNAGAQELNAKGKELYDGANTLQNGMSEVSGGISELSLGTGGLLSGATKLQDGADQLSDGTKELKDGASKLHDGTSELRSETKDIDTDVDEEIQKMLDEYRSSDFEYVSFTDERNKNVNSVQFVIRTENIEKPEVEVAEEKEEKKEEGFWDKLIGLFQ